MGSREFWIRILALTIISWWRKTSPDVLSSPPFKKQIFGLIQYFSYIFKVCVLGFSRETEPVWYIGDLLGEIDSCDYGGWEVPPSVICKPEGQPGQPAVPCQSQPKGLRTTGLYPVQGRRRLKVSQPSSRAGRRQILTSSSVCSVWVLSGLDGAHPHWGRQSTPLHPLIRMLISSRNTSQAHPEIMFKSGRPVAQSHWHIKLTITIRNTQEVKTIITVSLYYKSMARKEIYGVLWKI